jgi:hypothetical protein
MCIQSNKKLLYLITIIFIICLSCTTDYDQIWPLDGNRPITIEELQFEQELDSEQAIERIRMRLKEYADSMS